MLDILNVSYCEKLTFYLSLNAINNVLLNILQEETIS